MKHQVDLLKLKKGNIYKVPRYKKSNICVWENKKPQVWIDINQNPWWELNTGSLFKITGLYKKIQNKIWIPISYNEISGWMRLQDIMVCELISANENKELIYRKLKLEDLEKNKQVIDKKSKELLKVINWYTDKLPKKEYEAIVVVEKNNILYKKWLCELITF